MEETSCRTCWKHSEVMYDLFSKTLVDGTILKLSMMLTKIANVQVVEDDPFSNSICNKCFSKLLSAYQFINHVEETYRKLCKEKNYSDDLIDQKAGFLSKNFQLTPSAENKKDNELIELGENCDEILLIKSTDDAGNDDIRIVSIDEKKKNLDIKKLILNANQLNNKPENQTKVVSVKPELNSKVRKISNSESEHQITPSISKIDDNVIIIVKKKKIDRTIDQNPKKKDFDVASKCKQGQKRKKPDFYPCKVCSKIFLRKYQLDDHTKAHKDEELLDCSFDCGATFSSKANLLKHEEVHANSRKYLCPICGRAYNTPEALKGHKKHHDTAPLVCDVCGASFYKSNHLKYHLTTRHIANTEKYTDKQC